eukprot:Hpha_TRINITY_DN18365_c0_g1::TRINITY_DN18365_c0_g1_i1::g.158265::m.158265
MPGPRTAREEALLQRAKLLREEYRAIDEQLVASLGADGGEGGDDDTTKQALGEGVRMLSDFRDRLANMPKELSQHAYFADLLTRIEDFEDRRREIVRRQARGEAARVKRELLALLGEDALCDGTHHAESTVSGLREQCAAEATQAAEEAEVRAAELAEELRQMEEEEEARNRRRGHQEQLEVLRKQLDERDMELKELRLSLTRAQSRSDQEKARLREDAVLEFIDGEAYAARIAAAHQAGRDFEQQLELRDRADWRTKRDEAERQYAEQAAGRLAGTQKREALLRQREQRLAKVAGALQHLPEVQAVWTDIVGLT